MTCPGVPGLAQPQGRPTCGSFRKAASFRARASSSAALACCRRLLVGTKKCFRRRWLTHLCSFLTRRRNPLLKTCQSLGCGYFSQVQKSTVCGRERRRQASPRTTGPRRREAPEWPPSRADRKGPTGSALDSWPPPPGAEWAQPCPGASRARSPLAPQAFPTPSPAGAWASTLQGRWKPPASSADRMSVLLTCSLHRPHFLPGKPLLLPGTAWHGLPFPAASAPVPSSPAPPGPHQLPPLQIQVSPKNHLSSSSRPLQSPASSTPVWILLPSVPRSCFPESQ